MALPSDTRMSLVQSVATALLALDAPAETTAAQLPADEARAAARELRKWLRSQRGDVREREPVYQSNAQMLGGRR